MKRSKIIFIVLSIIFLAVMIYISIDMASRTQFPGSKATGKEQPAPSDTNKTSD